MKTLLNSKIFLLIVVIIQLGVLYGLSYWGYHTSRLPYWFDNFIQEQGIWRIYGQKSLKSIQTAENIPIDLRYDVIKSAKYSIPLTGFFRSIQQTDEGNQIWTLEEADLERVEVIGKPNLTTIPVRDCSDIYEEDLSCDDVEYKDKEISDMNQFIGQYISFNVNGDYDKATDIWEISIENVSVTLY